MIQHRCVALRIYPCNQEIKLGRGICLRKKAGSRERDFQISAILVELRQGWAPRALVSSLATRS